MSTDTLEPHRGVVEYLSCPLAYTVRGEGPPVLLIQGVGVHGDGWTPQTDALAGRFRCLTFDNRGMGRSVPAGAPVTVEGMAGDALAVMDAVGWTSAHVVGHSLGGPVALQMALSEPGRVRSLSLLCTFARGADATRLSAWMLWVGLRTRIGTRAMRRNAFLQLVMPPGALAGGDHAALAARLAPLFGHDLADSPAVAMKQLRALAAYDATARLGELAGTPTLVLSASHDPIAPPRSGKALAAGIPGARYVEFAHASHGLPIQCAGEVNPLLAQHLDAAERSFGATPR